MYYKAMWHRLFQAGVFVKGGHAVLDLFGAVFIYFTSATTLQNIIGSIVAEELVEDPNDVLVNFILDKTSHIAQATQDFAALYLFVSAIVNLVLVSGLLMRKPKMYPLAIGLTTAFVAYQAYVYLHTFSPWMLVLALYDSVLAFLIYLEYRRIKREDAVSHL